MSLALSLGATFVARSFSGDKAQLVPLLKAGLAHRGFAIIDVISPCVTFNDHEGSTKSYLHTRKHLMQMVRADFVPPANEITAEYPAGTTTAVTLHDGSVVRLSKVADGYDPTNRQAVQAELQRIHAKGEVATGLLYLDTKAVEMHQMSGTVDVPLTKIPYEKLCPGSAKLDALQNKYR